MKSHLIFLLKYALFWLFYAFIMRLMFLLFLWERTSGFRLSEFWLIFQKGARMDASLCGYILLLSCVFLAFLMPFLRSKTKIIFKILTLVLLVIFTVVSVGDMQAFNVWGYHLDTSVFEYLKNPKEVIGSATFGTWLVSIIVFLLIVASFYYLFEHWILRRWEITERKWWYSPILLFIGATMILPIRGSLNVSPMNISFVFFSKKFPFANQAAINPIWNFFYEWTHKNQRTQRFHFMDMKDAVAIVDSLYSSSDDYPSVLKQEKPNVVVILLESFTANAIEMLGGVKGVTPNLEKLSKEGILFSQIYATGARSDRGLVGVLSAMPSHPVSSALSSTKLASTMSTFSKELEKNGYSTHFYYAGDINFFRFKALATSNFQTIVSENDFSGEAVKSASKWGILDEFLFAKLVDDIEASEKPTFFFAFTLSSHEPFDVPPPKRIEGSTTEALFLNSVAYTDACLGDFMETCKKRGIWDNTLFVLVADHGVRYVNNPPPNDPKSFHIPLIFTGGAMAVTDSVVTTIGSQTDITATLLQQLNIDCSAYKYSRNLLSPSMPQAAFYANPSAVGMVSENGTTIFNLQGEFFTGDTIENNKQFLKAYLQTIDSEQMSGSSRANAHE